VTARTFGNGLTDTRTYDQQGRLTQQMLGGLSLIGCSYDANGNVLVRDSRNYQYDALDRLTQESDGTPISYGYDANGNRLNKVQGAQTTSYAYNAATNQLASIDVSSLAYDAAGNLITDEQGRSLTYNNIGRLSEVQQGGNTLATYTYDVQGCTSVAGAGCAGATNAQGQRTRKVTPSGTVVYHYDLAGNLIAETTATGAPIRDYVWQDATPLAQIDIQAGSETLVFLHTDHLQTPRLATNTSGTAVWRWEGEAFGNTPPNEDVDGDGQVTIINGRFPGQYADAETGLYYNWNRYYDSGTGTYPKSDPFGLNGGLNTYLYVGANPIANSDRFGLYTWTGTAWGGEAFAFVGGGGYVFDLESQCVNGKKAKITVWAVGSGGGVGLRLPKLLENLPIPTVNLGGHVEFDDFRLSGDIDASVFDGTFQSAGFGAQPIWGWSSTKFRCGRAHADDTGWGFGLNLGAGGIGGSCTVKQVEIESCCGG
jgi:RHS repeat-associated protein